ncbi:hypothetical protein ACIPUC_31540 [Streptomyces sp. LARHCF249]
MTNPFGGFDGEEPEEDRSQSPDSGSESWGSDDSQPDRDDRSTSDTDNSYQGDSSEEPWNDGGSPSGGDDQSTDSGSSGGGSTDSGKNSPEWEIVTMSGVDNVPAGYVALYDDSDFNQDEYSRESTGGQVLLTRVSIPSLKAIGFNDRASSVKNGAAYAAILFADVDYQGTRLLVPSGEGKPNLFTSAQGDSYRERFNDTVSSVRINTN